MMTRYEAHEQRRRLNRHLGLWTTVSRSVDADGVKTWFCITSVTVEDHTKEKEREDYV